MYLPVDVLVDEPPVAVVVEENPPANLDSQHLQHQHPLPNYQQQQHPQDVQPEPHDPDQYRIEHQPTYFLQPFQLEHLEHQQQQFSTLASSLRPEHASLQSGEHIFQQRCEFEKEKKQLHQHLNSQQLAPCADCSQPIKDRFYLLVAERCWHVDCLRCSICKTKLESQLTCFSRDGVIYCKDDYYQRFCKRCARCSRILSPKELVMRAKEFIFHMHCFNCVVCTSALQPGDYFALAPTGLLYCQLHYEPLFYGSGTVPVVPPIGSPTDSDTEIPGRNAGFGASSPGKSSCSEGIETTGGTSAKGASKGQKGRPKKRKSLASDQQQEVPASCMISQTDMTAVGHQAHLHPAAARNQHPSMMTGSSVGNLLMTSRAPVCQLPNAAGMIQSGRSSPSSGAGCSSSSIHSQSAQQQARSKRMRTSFKHQQLRTMKAYFTLNHNPDAKDLKQLAQKTGLTKRVLQVWFQNARAKYRRSIQVKQQMQDPQNPSKSPGPTNASGGDGLSSDIGEHTAFGTDQEDHSVDEERLAGGATSRRRSSDSSNPSSDYSHGSADGSSRCRSGFTEDETVGVQSTASGVGAGGPDHGCLPGDLQPHDDARDSRRLRDQPRSLSEDDSASRSLADYFQQCQGGLL